MEKWPKVDPAVWTSLKYGNKQAYSSIYRIYYSRLYNYGYKFTKNTTVVEDCIQEVLTAFWVNREKIEGVESFESYLFVSFRNRLMKSLQQNHLRTEIFSADEYEFEFEISIDQVMINADRLYEQQIDLKSALDKLTQRQKEAIYFKYYEDLSYEQISGILNISTKATYKLVARAIGELRLICQQKISTFLLFLTMYATCSAI